MNEFDIEFGVDYYDQFCMVYCGFKGEIFIL